MKFWGNIRMGRERRATVTVVGGGGGENGGVGAQ